jgi:DNA replication protein DnaC
MLTQPLIEQLHSLRCIGMADALREQLQTPEASSLSFEERLAFLIDRELLLREQRAISGKLRHARLREQACIEDIDYKASRGLSKMQINQLALCHWIKNKENVLITGPTGTGKTYLACALAHKACRMRLGARYIRLPKLFQTMDIAKADGSYAKLLEQIAKIPLLVLDDWGVAPMTDANRRDFLELIDDRYQRSSTLITSQLPVSLWHNSIGDATLGDAILDRLIHNTHRIELTGDSMRKNKIQKLEKKEN